MNRSYDRPAPSIIEGRAWSLVAVSMFRWNSHASASLTLNVRSCGERPLPAIRTFEGRVRALFEGHPTLTALADALLAARSVPHRESQGFQRKVRSLARRDDRAGLLMSALGVGVLVSLFPQVACRLPPA